MQSDPSGGSEGVSISQSSGKTVSIMADDKLGKGVGAGKGMTKGDEIPFEFDAPAGAVTVSTGRSMYKPEVCKTADGKHYPVCGHLIGAEILGAESQNGAFTGLIFRLTKPTMTPDAKGVLTRRNPGEEVIIVQTYELKGLEEVADDNKMVAEFFIKPTNKETLANGHSLWHYDVKFVGKGLRDKIATKVASIFGGDSAPALPAGASA
jgi:hypothetical protein